MKRYLTDAEQTRLLKSAKSSSDLLAQRDYWWMRLMIATGCRVREFSLFNADQAQAALRCGWLIALPAQRKRPPTPRHQEGKPAAKPKAAKPMEYLVTENVRECLQQLLRVHAAMAPDTWPAEEPAPLVWSEKGNRMSVRSYQVRMRHWAEQAELGLKVSPHWLRHTRGMNIMRRSRSTNPLKTAQLALGHSSISSTGVYTTMAREEYTADLQVVDRTRLPRSAARAQALAQGAAA